MPLLVIVAVASDRKSSPADPARIWLISGVDSHVRNNRGLLVCEEAAAFASVARALAVVADRSFEVQRFYV